MCSVCTVSEDNVLSCTVSDLYCTALICTVLHSICMYCIRTVQYLIRIESECAVSVHYLQVQCRPHVVLHGAVSLQYLHALYLQSICMYCIFCSILMYCICSAQYLYSSCMVQYLCSICMSCIRTVCTVSVPCTAFACTVSDYLCGILEQSQC
jgi:hypothetical protein